MKEKMGEILPKMTNEICARELHKLPNLSYIASVYTKLNTSKYTYL